MREYMTPAQHAQVCREGWTPALIHVKIYASGLPLLAENTNRRNRSPKPGRHLFAASHEAPEKVTRKLPKSYQKGTESGPSPGSSVIVFSLGGKQRKRRICKAAKPSLGALHVGQVGCFPCSGA